MASVLRTPLFSLSPVCGASASSRGSTTKALLRLPPGWRPAELPSFKICTTASKPLRILSFPRLRAYGETAETTDKVDDATAVDEDSEGEIQVDDGAPDGGIVDTEKEASSTILETLQAYKEALANEDESTIADIEGFLLSIEEEKSSLAAKVTSLSEELAVEKDRVLRISADFDNFRKRTERERLSLMSNVQGEVLEKLLPVLDNFERGRDQIKTETEGEEKINKSYQGIYKQFVEILNSLGVEAVETVGNPFDPMLHEAIMREDSTEFEEGVILQEFRKGFKLGDRLLRPSMVKVSAGPGPAKTSEAISPPESGESSPAIDEAAQTN